MEKAYFSIFKDGIESLNTDDVRSVFLKKERDNAMKPNFNIKCAFALVNLSHLFTVDGCLKTNE